MLLFSWQMICLLRYVDDHSLHVSKASTRMYYDYNPQDCFIKDLHPGKY